MQLWAGVVSGTDLVASINGQRLLLCANDGDVIIGREVSSAGIHLSHPAISRLHARLAPGPQWKIVDYESRNGIYLDGRRVYEATLTEGMTIRLGAPDGLAVEFDYADPGDITDVITPEIRLGHLLDAAARSLDDIADSLSELGVATDPDYRDRTANLRRRIGELTAILSRCPDAAGSAGVQALLRVARISAELLPPDDPGGECRGRAGTAYAATGATLRSQELKP
ncbi:hypothetical protein BVU76_29950 [Mycolicibacterium porcinum]|nr:hypothetical protein BVU76_29950 [Mycolicibacterium porcinum]